MPKGKKKKSRAERKLARRQEEQRLGRAMAEEFAANLAADDAEEAGFSADRLELAYRVVADAVDRGEVMGAAMQVSRGATVLEPRTFGRAASRADGPAVTPETVFLLASITKPMVVVAAMFLVEDGKMSLDEPVAEIVPEFAAKGKGAVLVRHLMTHTSGLPDMLPRNLELRARKAPLSEFVRGACEADLLFPPGTRISYQSMGFAVLGSIVERLANVSLPAFIHRELFERCSLESTGLGADDDWADRIAEVKIPAGDPGFGGPADTEWNWNSAYWRKLATPWGGMFSTVTELTTLLRLFIAEGTIEDDMLGEVDILSPAMVAAMTADHTTGLPDLPIQERLRERWGLGWRLNAVSGSWFGDLASEDAFGHTGATGTLAWADPTHMTTLVLLTNDPAGARKLRPRVSNAVQAALKRQDIGEMLDMLGDYPG